MFNKKLAIYLIIFFTTLTIYYFSVDQELFEKPHISHYNYLANALLQGKIDIENAHNLPDFSQYDGKLYVPFPPLPAIILIPFVFFFGINFNTIYLTIILGALSVVLMYSMLCKINSNKLLCILLTMGFGFGTVYWWVTIRNSVYFLAQVFAVFFIILALLESLNKKRPIVLALFLGFAFMCRQLTIFALPYFIYVLLDKDIKNLYALIHRSKQQYLKRVIIFLLVLSIFILQYLLYNYLRFGNPFDTGYEYIALSSFLSERFSNGGLFSINHFMFNLYYFLFRAPDFVFNSYIWSAPYIQFDPNGLALIFTSPFLLFAFRNLSRKTAHIWISIILVFLPQLFYYNTGWIQFGYRFFLDILPFCMLLLGSYRFQKVNISLLVLILYSIIINFLGVFTLR